MPTCRTSLWFLTNNSVFKRVYPSTAVTVGIAATRSRRYAAAYHYAARGTGTALEATNTTSPSTISPEDTSDSHSSFTQTTAQDEDLSGDMMLDVHPNTQTAPPISDQPEQLEKTSPGEEMDIDEESRNERMVITLV
jgi:hypothetical protein